MVVGGPAEREPILPRRFNELCDAGPFGSRTGRLGRPTGDTHLICHTRYLSTHILFS